MALSMYTVRSAQVAAVVLSSFAVAACGGGDDNEPTDAREPAATGASGTRAAERLEAYLKKNTDDLRAQHTETGEVLSHVEPDGDSFKVWTFVNPEIKAEREMAGEVCKRIRASKIPGAENATVVHGGGGELRRC